MATVTAARAAATFPVFAGSSGNLRCAYGTYELATNLAAATIIEMVRLPAGAVVVGGWIYGDDLDTGTEELDFDFGWAANGAESADPDGFGNFDVITGDVFALGNVAKVAGIMYPLQGVLLTSGPQAFTRETVLQIVINVDSAGGGTGTLSAVVHYVVP